MILDQSWLSHWMGLDNLSGPLYGFWSGIGSDVGELAIVGAVIGAVRAANCQTKGCWRVGRHDYEMDGAKRKLCHVHHPHLETRQVTSAQVMEHHKRHEAEKADAHTTA